MGGREPRIRRSRRGSTRGIRVVLALGSITDPTAPATRGSGAECGRRVWWFTDRTTAVPVMGWDYVAAHPEVDARSGEDIYAREEKSSPDTDPLHALLF